MAHRRDTDRHPAKPRAVSNVHAMSPDGRHLHAVSDLPGVLPTLIGGDDDPEVDQYEVLEMSLSLDQLTVLHDAGLTVSDVLDGNVPGMDPEKIVAKAMDETGSHNGPWSPME
jgi:hypothetical protein